MRETRFFHRHKVVKTSSTVSNRIFETSRERRKERNW